MIRYLRRRVGSRWVPILGLNLIVPAGIILRNLSSKDPVSFEEGLGNIYRTENLAALLTIYFVIVNIIPALYIYSIFAYRLGYDDDAVYARPYPRSGPYMRIPFNEIDRVDLFPFTTLDDAMGEGRQSNSPNRRANIRIYRKNGGREEIFLIVPSQLHGSELKALVRMIHDRRPDTFSSEMQHYLESDELYPPYALAEKDGRPVYKW